LEFKQKGVFHAFCIFTVLNQFLSKSFSTANGILGVYFQVSLAQLD